jgi:hypothetical protein
VAMIKCRECGSAISSEAAACPQCGAKPRRNSGCATLLIGFLCLIFVMSVVRGCKEKSSTSPAQSAAPSASNSQPREQTAEEKKAAYEAKLKADSAEIAVIEGRLKSTREHLKKYYANPSQVSAAKSDVLNLTGWAAFYGEQSDDQGKALAKRAKAMVPEAELRLRQLYASSLEQIFVKSGINADVTVTGKEKKTLRIKYALMSKAVVYKLQNEVDIPKQARAVGFKKLIYTDGFQSEFGETWTVDL